MLSKLKLSNSFPVRKPKRKAVDLYWVGIVLESKKRVLLKKNQKGDWWQDLWDFPILKFKDKRAFENALSVLKKEFPQIPEWEKLAPQKHTVTHHRIHFQPFVGKASKKPSLKPYELKWWEIEKVPTAPTSSLVKKVMATFH